MIIYDAEKSIAKLITENTKVSTVASVTLNDDVKKSYAKYLKQDNPDDVKDLIVKAGECITKNNAPDILFGSAILVTTSRNRNDDVFLPDETWAARYSPVHKPFNDQHKEKAIIGHIFNVRAKDQSMAELPLDTDDHPDFYHLECDFALYKMIHPDKADEIINGFKTNSSFVSMECLFSDFDYLLVKGQEFQIIQRNESTAFLSNHLRAYGGNGKYQEYEVARVLKNITFVGMGNVDVPANPDSFYTSLGNFNTKISKNNEDFKSLVYIPSNDTNIYFIEGRIMKVETIEQANQVIKDLSEKLEAQKAQLDELKSKDTKELQEKLDKTLESVVSLTKDLQDAHEQIADLDEKLGAKTKSFDEAQAELTNIKLETVAKDRLAKLVEAGVEIQDADAELKKLKSLSDDAFDFALTSLAKMAKKEVKTEQSVATKVMDQAKVEKDAEDVVTESAAGKAEEDLYAKATSALLIALNKNVKEDEE